MIEYGCLYVLEEENFSQKVPSKIDKFIYFPKFFKVRYEKGMVRGKRYDGNGQWTGGDEKRRGMGWEWQGEGRYVKRSGL